MDTKTYENTRRGIIEVSLEINMLLTFGIIIDGERKSRENARNFPKGECCCRRGGKYWDVIYGYKYWRSLEPGKRIVEFAGSREFRKENECFLFSFYQSLSPLPPPGPRRRSAFRAVSDRKSNSRFIRRTDWSTCLRVAKSESPFHRDFNREKK